jgi:Fic family protein
MAGDTTYSPPYHIAPPILSLVAEIGEMIGRYTALSEQSTTPHLRRKNRIRTIQASLAIENNTLTLDQVSAIIEGKRVLGDPREIQEVRNAFAAYDAMPQWSPTSLEDLLTAHRLLMSTLIDEPGKFRTAGVGIFRGERLIHLAPPADRVRALVNDLLHWLAQTHEHPLITGCVFHYELEFIHPFADGNGRMGRLWQTLILTQWKSLFAFLPVETIIRDRQEDYYQALAEADKRADSTVFVEFMLMALRDSLREAMATSLETDQVSDQVTDQVTALLRVLEQGELGSTELLEALGLSHRPSFRENYLNPAIEAGWVERTQPDAPRSPTQRYRLTEKARQWLRRN